MNDQNNNFTNNQQPVNPYNYSPSATPDSEAKAPAPKDTNRGNAIKAMVFGIIAAYLAWLPFFSIAGIIFGVIAKRRGDEIMLSSPPSRATYNFAKAGRITGKIGFIAGIIMTVFWVFYFILIIAALLGSGI